MNIIFSLNTFLDEDDETLKYNAQILLDGEW